MGSGDVVVPSSCDHCGLPAGAPIVKNDLTFCCHGCSMAYQLLRSLPVDLINPVEKQTENFSFLDSEAAIEQFAFGENNNCMSFYVEGVQCGTCLWLLEGISKWVSGVESARLKMGQDILTLEINSEQTSFQKVAEFIWAIGYKPHAIEKPSEADIIRKKEAKSLLLKMGVAAFVAGNIMLMTISIYSGVPKSYELLFNWISVFLFLPVLFYSSRPFYSSALRSLKLKRANIDVPIVLAIVFGFGLSLIHLMNKSGEVYFDSLAALVALLLASRIFLKSIQRNFLSSNHLTSFITNQSIEIKKSGDSRFTSLWPTEIETGDILKLRYGQVLPVEAVLENKKAKFNSALMTGESLPRTLFMGDKVQSGYKCLQEFVELKAIGGWEDSDINSLINEIELAATEKSEYVKKLDKWAHGFTYAIISIAVLFFAIYSQQNLDAALQRVLAFIIVACPCALAFAAPLLESLSLMAATSEGILVKSAVTLEKINKVKNIFLDKTGTITSSNLSVQNWQNSELPFSDVFYSMEVRSGHPIAKIIAESLADNAPIELIDLLVEEIPGKGVKAKYQGVDYFIGQLSEKDQSAHLTEERIVGFYKGNTLVNVAHISEFVTDESTAAVKMLKSRGYHLLMLTGDSLGPSQKIAEKLKIDFHAGLLPSDKQNIVSEAGNSIMVGDGFNDLHAFTSSDVSVAVQGSMESCLKFSDIYFLKNGLRPLLTIIDIANRFHKGFYFVLSFSLAYNIVFGSLALMGFVSPLVAAIAMPLSSLFVVALSFLCVYSSKIFNRRIKVKDTEALKGQKRFNTNAMPEGV